jgi:HIRAN domain
VGVAGICWSTTYRLSLLADCNIVGVRHYDGIVDVSDTVGLVRQPDNEYDENAIRVDDSNGVQVGQYEPRVLIWLTSQYPSRLCCHSGTIVRHRDVTN